MSPSGMRQADFRQTFYQEAYLFSALTRYQQDIKHHPDSRGCSFYPSSVSLEILLKALFLPQRNPKYFLEIALEFYFCSTFTVEVQLPGEGNIVVAPLV